MKPGGPPSRGLPDKNGARAGGLGPTFPVCVSPNRDCRNIPGAQMFGARSP